jgi:two-component system, NarL family, invasion response regulator UvrY
MIRILIVDDHPMVRRGLKQTIEEIPGEVKVDEATNGVEALNKARTGNYDVVILDIDLPGKNGMDVLEQIKHEKPTLPVLMLTMYSEEQLAVRALKTGASGYLTKGSAPDELVTAVQKVLSGGKYVSASLAEHLASMLQQAERKPYETLSNREYQVMCLIASGKTATEIARELFLSIKTVSTYRSRILKKTGTKNNVELAKYALQNNLLSKYSA